MIHAIEQDYFWFRGRRKLVLSLLKRFIKNDVTTLLDVGCGTGFNLKFLGQFSDQVIGLDRLSGSPAHHQIAGSLLFRLFTAYTAKESQ